MKYQKYQKGLPGRVFLTSAGIDFVAQELRALYIFGDRLTMAMLRGWVEDIEARIAAGEGAEMEIASTETSTGRPETVTVPAEFLGFRS